jgi:hypothetical protein
MICLQTDGHGETSMPPYNFVAGGIKQLPHTNNKDGDSDDGCDNILVLNATLNNILVISLQSASICR